MTQQELNDIYAYLSEIKHQLNDIQNQKASYLGELFKALSAAQAEMETAGLTANNPFFKSKYADLAEIVKASRPALTKHGLAIMQCVHQKDDGSQVLLTILGHSSGQSISSEIAITPSKTDVQSLGSYITYLRRYSYAALVGVIVCDEDDDGNNAVPARYEKISKEQMQELVKQADNAELLNKICTKLKVEGVSAIPADKYADVLAYVKAQKK